jgi:hypothetical protein
MPGRFEVFAVSVFAAQDDGRCAMERPTLNGSVVARVTAVTRDFPFHHHEPSGSERRRGTLYGTLWSGGPTNSGTQTRRLSYINATISSQLDLHKNYILL